MNKEMIIKVCGMRDAANIKEVSQLDIDWMGFIFFPKSSRYVRQINSNAGFIPDYPSLHNKDGDEPSPKKIKRVGVFVDDMPQNIVTRVVNFRLDIVQLHGSENAIMIDNLRRTLEPDIHKGIKIMKALSVASAADVEKYKDYEGHVDYFLFDTKTPLKGGSGNKFDWSVLDAYDGKTPFLLSGGTGPDDVERIREFNHPKCIGIDVNSRFETVPGVKDAALLKSFVEALRG